MSDDTRVRPKVAIIYYSSTGTVHELATEYAAGATDAGAEVRLLRVGELAPDAAIDSNPAWRAHADATADQPQATPEDALWADAIVFGTPTRFGNVSAQLKQFIDTLGGLWNQGLLADKVYSGFTSTATGGGRESTLLALYQTVHHFGGIQVTPGYTDPIQFVTGTPYGPSHSTVQGTVPLSDDTRDSTRYAGTRVTQVTRHLLGGRTLEQRAEGTR